MALQARGAYEPGPIVDAAYAAAQALAKVDQQRAEEMMRKYLKGEPEGQAQADYDPGGWANNVTQELSSIFGDWATKQGYGRNVGQEMVEQLWPSVEPMIQDYIRGGSMNPDRIQERINGFLRSPEGYNKLIGLAANYMAGQLGITGPSVTGGGGGGGGRRGGGGGGGGGMSPDQIRAQFDQQQLADRAMAMGRTYLIKDIDNPSALAKSYVEAVVANPQQKLDYDQYVKERLKKDPRWATIFKFKPEGVDEALYLNNNFVQPALATIGGGNGFEDASDFAFRGAAMGATPDAMRGMLNMSRAVRHSSAYINKLDETVRGVAGVLR